MFEISDSEVEGGTCTIYVVKTKVAISCIYIYIYIYIYTKDRLSCDVARMSHVTRKPVL